MFNQFQAKMRKKMFLCRIWCKIIELKMHINYRFQDNTKPNIIHTITVQRHVRMNSNSTVIQIINMLTALLWPTQLGLTWHAINGQCI